MNDSTDTTNDRWYEIEEPGAIASPALVVDRERVVANIEAAIELAGSPSRLRPHVKTHKCPEVVRLHLERGVTHFKCATVAEARMLAEAGARDVLLAYQPVGPTIRLFLELAHRMRGTSFACLVDDAAVLDSLDLLAERVGTGVRVFLDYDVGMHRTGVAEKERAADLYRRIAGARWVAAGGVHAYDGHTTARDPEKREEQAAQARENAVALVAELDAAGLSAPEVVFSGTPGFPFHAAALQATAGGPDGPTVRLSPGTYAYFDWGYAEAYPDLPFKPAAFVLGRVISVREAGSFTIDVGSKAICADPPGERGTILNLSGARAGRQSEEHWEYSIDPIHTPTVGQVVYVWPRHICTSVEHYDHVQVISEGRWITKWPVSARGRSA